jgi:hypothetical protein
VQVSQRLAVGVAGDAITRTTLTPPAVEPAIAPIGITSSSTSWAVWLHRPYSVTTYPVVVTVDTVVNNESRNPAAWPPSLPDATKDQSVTGDDREVHLELRRTQQRLRVAPQRPVVEREAAAGEQHRDDADPLDRAESKCPIDPWYGENPPVDTVVKLCDTAS